MEKRTLIVVLLTTAIWVAWFFIFKPEQNVKKEPVTETTKQVETTAAKDTGRKKTKAGPVSMAVPETVEKKETTFKQITEKFEFTLSNKGAVIKNVKYLERKIELSVPTNPFKASGMLDFPIHFNEDDFLKGNMLDEAIWSAKKSDDDTIIFSTKIIINDSPVIIEKIYSFPQKGYAINLEYRFKNAGKKSVSFDNNTVIFSAADLIGPSLDFTNTYNKLSGIYLKDGDFEEINKGDSGSIFSCFTKTTEEPLKKNSGTINWAGVMSRYFLVIMIPEKVETKGMIHDNRKNHGIRTGINAVIGELVPGKEISKSFKVYIGEKDKEKLASVDKSLIPAADVSKWIEPIRFFVLWCLMGINKFIGNLGWSLVIFSILTKVVFMPLTKKSTDSMKKMQALTPKLNELKAKYKDKPDVLQKEMMKLYKDNKVNPMGGCLPLLLQMPFFFALYSALGNSIDLWNAPFIFWMKDLSMPDTVATISGFNINILPIVMTATTFLQQKLSTVDTGNQQQQMMMMMMPLIFIFIFWSMPSGLVLYWTLQNVFQIAQQLIVNKMSKKELEA